MSCDYEVCNDVVLIFDVEKFQFKGVTVCLIVWAANEILLLLLILFLLLLFWKSRQCRVR